MRRFTVAFGACLAAGALQAAVQIDGSLAEKLTRPCVYTNAAGKTFNYRWHEPAEMADWKRYPLVVLMHGAGERGDDNKKQLVWVANNLFTYMKHQDEVRKAWPPYETKEAEFFLLAGQVPLGKQWVDTPWAAKSHTMNPEPSETMGLQIELIEKMFAKYPQIDRRRVYAVGLSMGGYGTWDLISRKPEWFAAAIPMCGGGDVAMAPRLKDIGIWAFHGSWDGAVPVCRSRDMISALWKCEAPDVRYTEKPRGSHDVWSIASGTYGDFSAFNWLFEQRRPVGPVVKGRHPNSKDWAPLFADDLSDADTKPGEWVREKVNGGGQTALVPKSGAAIYTKRDYSDFVLDMQYSVNAGANGGVFIYTDGTRDNGVEVQLMDDRDPVGNDIPYALSGSLYGRATAKVAAVTKDPAWCWRNNLTIWAKGKRIRVLLNGVEVQNANLDDFTSVNNPDGTVVPPWQRSQPLWCSIPTKGRIGLQGNHGKSSWFVWYARIRPLTNADAF